MRAADLKGKSASEILECFKNIEIKSGEILEVELLDSDLTYFGYKSFMDLAHLFFMRFLTPIKKENTTVLRFEKLDVTNSFHDAEDEKSEKYGIKSRFFTIEKAKEFSFLYHYQKALEFIDIKNKKK